MKLFRNLRFITGRWPLSFLFTKNKVLRNSPSSDLALSSTFPLFLNLFVTSPFGSPLLIGEDHTEMGFERKEFWNPAQWKKYSHLELIFPNFLNEVGGLFLLNAVGVDLVSLRRTSWYFCLVLRLVHQFSLKFCPNNSWWL